MENQLRTALEAVTADLKARVKAQHTRMQERTVARYTELRDTTNVLNMRYENATMEIHNNIILKVSKYGKPFNQYPTTFRNVLVNGEKVKRASEKNVKEAMSKEGVK